jgi:hypothetical protein
VQPIKSKNGGPAKFHMQVYKRCERWMHKRNVKGDIKYAPLIKKTTGTIGQPDMILTLYRDPSSIKLNSKDDFTEGCYMELTLSNKKFINKIVLDPTLWREKDKRPEVWDARIRRMREYANSLLGGDARTVFPIVVMPQGWDNSLDHGIEKKVHIISADYLETLLDIINEATEYDEVEKSLKEILFSKHETCPVCGSRQLSYERLYSCSYFQGPYENLTEEVIDAFTDFEDIDKGMVEYNALCEGCGEYQYCDKFFYDTSLVCWKCGNIFSSDGEIRGELHACAHSIHHSFDDDCTMCDEPHECKKFQELLETGAIIKLPKPKILNQAKIENFH